MDFNDILKKELLGHYDMMKAMRRQRRHDRESALVQKVVELNIRRGTVVTFEGRYGVKVKGVVAKVGRSRVHVIEEGGRMWTVPPRFITAASK